MINSGYVIEVVDIMKVNYSTNGPDSWGMLIFKLHVLWVNVKVTEYLNGVSECLPIMS